MIVFYELYFLLFIGYDLEAGGGSREGEHFKLDVQGQGGKRI